MTSPVLLTPPEYVLAAWISTIPGFTADSVAPVLPASEDLWKTNGAVTMFVVGGTEDPYIAVSKTVLQVECWTCNPQSNKPKWLQSWALARQIRMACLDRLSMNRALEVEVGGVVYPGAAVRTVVVLNAARRVYGQKDDYAGHIFDVAMTWTENGQVTR